jgi:hypothetical protein
MRDVAALRKEMQSAGVWVFSGGLHASDSATVLRDQGGDIVLTDGPFIESKEQIGGITIVRVPDLDAAVVQLMPHVQGFPREAEGGAFLNESGANT